MKKYFAILLFAMLALGLCAPSVLAQASGSVKGVCKDAQGNPIADAVVVWANMDNGQKYTLQPNQTKAQASGSVKGVCKDAQGNPIADAVVVWANMDNGQKYTLKTNKKGEYFSLGLSPGKYLVTLYKNADDAKANKEMD